LLRLLLCSANNDVAPGVLPASGRRAMCRLGVASRKCGSAKHLSRWRAAEVLRADWIAYAQTPAGMAAAPSSRVCVTHRYALGTQRKGVDPVPGQRLTEHVLAVATHGGRRLLGH
jgi:hypothetical protein